MIRKMNVVFLILLFSLLGRSAYPQADTGSIAGVVKDSSGAVVPDATVTGKNIATTTDRSTKTDSVGGYTIRSLPPGIYDVTVSKTGFSDYKVRAQVSVGGHVTVDAQLSITAIATTIEVVGAGGVEINTQNQEVSQLITSDLVQQLPSLTRNPYDFITLAGNVSNGDRAVSNGNPQIGGAGQNGTDRGLGFNLNGQRSSGTEILLDGAENSNIFDTTIGILIPTEALQEYRIITNNFDAQYGRASGGVVNVVTKSGTNALHGDAFEFNRLSAYTANTFDNVASGVPKGTYVRNQFGYDVGGPVKKDKLFFFHSTEWTRVRSSASVLAYVPTPQLLALTAANVQAFFNAFGNQTFSFVGPPLPKTTKIVSLCNDFTAPDKTKGCSDGSTPTGQPVPFVGSSAGTPAAKCSPSPCPFSQVPDGTAAFGLVNYTAPLDAGGDVPQNTYALIARADYNFSPKTQMYFRFGRESLLALPGSIFAGPYPQYNVGETIYNNNYLGSISHSFTQNVLSSTRLSFFRDDEANQYKIALQDTPTLFLYNNAKISGQSVQLPGFNDFATGTGGLPYGGPQNTMQINEDLSWVKGKHGMKYGAQINYIQLNRGYGAYAQPVEQLGKNVGAGLDNLMTGTLTDFKAAVNPAGKFPCVGSSYTSTLKGGTAIPSANCTLTPPLTKPVFNRGNRYKDWALYAEDNWRVTPKLSLNYGVRYEHFDVQHNADPTLDSNLYYGPGSNIFQQINTATLQLAPNSPIGELWKPRWGTVGPRVGFAYDVFGDGRTALRGGYGISYEKNFGNVTFNVIQNPPNNATVDVTSGATVTTNPLGPLASGGSGSPILLPPVSPRNVAQDIQVAQTQFWSLTMERKLGSTSVVALEYNGAHGVHLYDIKNLNEIGGGQIYLGQPLVTSDPNNSKCTMANPCLTRPNQQLTSINNRGTGGYSHYNGLNVHFQTQNLMGTGLTVASNYTWSHSLDNESSTFSESSAGQLGVGNLGYLDPRNPALDYGSSDFDVRNRFTFSAIWNEPFLQGSKGVLKQVAGGWSIKSIFVARSGIPYTISDSNNCLNCLTGPYGVPRYVPTGTIPSFAPTSAADQGGNVFNILTLPTANSFTGLLGVSDFGPYPANMTARNNFVAPGAWNLDLSLAKTFPITERVKLKFGAEGFNILNHHNLYVDGFLTDAGNFAAGQPVIITAKKGGLGVSANNGQHDERRFGQFELRVSF